MIDPVAFKLTLRKVEGTKYHWDFYAKAAALEGEYNSEDSSIVGTARWTDFFPLTYTVGKELEGLGSQGLKICEEIIHNNLALWIPQALIQAEYGHIVFTPPFPPYVGHGQIFWEIAGQLKQRHLLFPTK